MKPWHKQKRCSLCKYYLPGEYRCNPHSTTKWETEPSRGGCNFYERSLSRVRKHLKDKRKKQAAAFRPDIKRCGFCLHFEGYRCLPGGNWVDYNTKGCEEFQRDFKKLVEYIKRKEKR